MYHIAMFTQTIQMLFLLISSNISALPLIENKCQIDVIPVDVPIKCDLSLYLHAYTNSKIHK